MREGGQGARAATAPVGLEGFWPGLPTEVVESGDCSRTATWINHHLLFSGGLLESVGVWCSQTYAVSGRPDALVLQALEKSKS